MTKTGEQLNVSDLDFATIKSNLINYFKGSNTGISDWDFEGSNLNTIIDVLAYNTHYNAMLAHMAVNESFIDSAQLRTSVVSAAKLLGYVPRSYSAAKGELLLNLRPKTNIVPDSRYVVPRGTAFATTYENSRYQFVVLDDICELQLQDGVYKNNPDNPLIVYQGRLVQVKYEANGFDINQRYELDDENIDISTLRVWVYPTNNESDGTQTVFRRYSSIDVNENSPIYFINENNFGKYELSFGNGIFGRKLNAGNLIVIEYLVTDGSAPNGANGTFQLIYDNPILDTLGASIVLKDNQRVSGGGEKETLDVLKQNALNTFNTQNRAVTSDDYRGLILSNFSDIESVSVWGGEDNIPPIYGKALICAKQKDSNSPLTAASKKSILDYLSNKKVLAITPHIVDAEYCNLVLDIFIKYDSNISTLSASQLQQKIRNELLVEYNRSVLNSFDSIFRHSTFTRTLDLYNRSIINSLVRVYLSQTFEISNITNSLRPGQINLNFGAELQADDDRVIMEVVTNTAWTENDVPIFLKDEKTQDPNIRNVYIYTISDNINRKIRDVGQIDLRRGQLTLSGVFTDNNIQITVIVNPISSDIVGKRNILLNIDLNNANINAFPDEVARGGTSRTIDYVAFPKDRQ